MQSSCHSRPTLASHLNAAVSVWPVAWNASISISVSSRKAEKCLSLASNSPGSRPSRSHSGSRLARPRARPRKKRTMDSCTHRPSCSSHSLNSGATFTPIMVFMICPSTFKDSDIRITHHYYESAYEFSRGTPISGPDFSQIVNDYKLTLSMLVYVHDFFAHCRNNYRKL